jgi:hypothetical protein
LNGVGRLWSAVDVAGAPTLRAAALGAGCALGRGRGRNQGQENEGAPQVHLCDRFKVVKVA